MKKKNRRVKPGEQLRPEYDLQSLGNGVRGKYAKRYGAGTNLVLLSPEIAAHFPDQKSVESALKLVIRLQGHSRKKARQ